jgi:hypothetical protein
VLSSLPSACLESSAGFRDALCRFYLMPHRIDSLAQCVIQQTVQQRFDFDHE